MCDSPGSLTVEFLKLIECLSNGNDSGLNGNTIFTIPYRTEELSKETQLTSKLETELVTLLDEFDISEPLKFNLYDVLKEYDVYFNARNKKPFQYVNEIVMNATLGSKDISSVLQLLFLLRDKACLPESQLTNGAISDISDNNLQLNKENIEELMPDEFLSSQLRQLYYSPLILDSETGLTPTNVNIQGYNGVPTDKNQLNDIANVTEITKSNSPNTFVNGDSNVLSETDLVLDLINVLKGVDGKYIKRMKTECRLVNSTLKISTDFKIAIVKITFMAKLYHTIKLYLSQLNSLNPISSQSQHNLKKLTDYIKLLNLLLNSEDSLTLLKLFELLHKPYRKIRIIYSLLSCDRLSPNFLYKFTFTGNSELRRMYLRLLKKSLIPFFEAIFQWLYLGELSSDSSHIGFFINFSEGYFKFDDSKLFLFFPRTLAKDIFEKGLLLNQLNRMKKTNPTTTTLNTFLQLLNLQSELSQLQNMSNTDTDNKYTEDTNTKATPFGAGTDTVNNNNEINEIDEEWTLECTLTSLKNIVSTLKYSEEIASCFIKEYQLFEYTKNVLLRIITPSSPPMNNYSTKNNINTFSSKILSEDVDRRDHLEVISSFPYSLLFGDSYEFFNSLLSLSRLFNSAVDFLNQMFLDYLWFYRLSTGILDLSSFFNKINLYRSEMLSFLFSVQPFYDVQFYFALFQEDLQLSKDLSQLRHSLSRFKKNLKFQPFPLLTTCFKNILDFSSSVLRIFTSLNNFDHTSNGAIINSGNSFRNYLHGLMDTMEPVNVVKHLEDKLIDDSSSWAILHYALEFRQNVTNLSGHPFIPPLMGINNYYIINKSK
ncbi:uncharacterized protein TA19150 [Theileria annulata]|uniref:Spindle pole body component n=1 Tax=Theileria annulata TaxID=5874 RepID=Q4UGA7_THEAN|nr:uncharacterized protein TA19150 [Theileria annulata]CAI73882.1 hypothetical protein TA19150 [Theileria annulata]|eukprot:XP_954559.1 hypothetical protein TA19150 [Theileria annulata]